MSTNQRGPRDRSDDELARSLRSLRAAAGLDQIPAAKTAGISQATLSRAERGQAALRPDNLTKLLTAYGVSDGEQRAHLLSLTRVKRDERVDARVILQAGAHHVQRRIRELEEDATEIRAYQPAAVFGVAQTGDYMSAVFRQRGATSDEIALRVAERLQRRALLDQPGRAWTLIQTEGALRWHLHSPQVMSAQIDDLAATSQLPGVRLGVVDWRTPADFLVMNGFHIYDHHTVQVGTRDGTAFLTDQDKVADYIDLFRMLEQVATFGDQCREVLARIAAAYRSLAGESRRNTLE